MPAVERNENGLPADFDKRLSNLRKKMWLGRNRNEEIRDQIFDLSRGIDSEGISKFYQGWTEDDYKALLAALDTYAEEDKRAALALEQQETLDEVDALL